MESRKRYMQARQKFLPQVVFYNMSFKFYAAYFITVKSHFYFVNLKLALSFIAVF